MLTLNMIVLMSFKLMPSPNPFIPFNEASRLQP
jgi:hypothetical protein